MMAGLMAQGRDAANFKREQEADAAAAETLAQQQAAASQGIAGFLAPLQEQVGPEAWNILQSSQEMLADPLTFETGMKGIEEVLKDRSGLRADMAKDQAQWSASKRLAMELFPGDIDKQQAFIQEHAMKAGVSIDQGEKYVSVSDLGKLMDSNGNPLPPGITWDEARSMGAVLRETETADKAGKLTMMQTAQGLFSKIDDLMFDEEGNPDTETIRNAFAISLDPTPGEMLSKVGISLFGDEQKASDAGNLYQAFEQGFQAMTRTETGAAMPPEEIENTKRRFRPGPLDSDEEVMQKYNAYKFFINNAINLMRPQKGQAKRYGDNVAALSQDINRLADQALIQAGVSQKPKVDASGNGEDNMYEYVTVPEGESMEGWTPVPGVNQ